MNISIYIHDNIILVVYINDTFCNIKLYQEFIDFLNYLAIFTHSNIIFAIFKLSKYNFNSIIIYFKIDLYILHYLKTIYNYCIIYKKSINVSIFDIIDYFD